MGLPSGWACLVKYCASIAEVAKHMERIIELDWMDKVRETSWSQPWDCFMGVVPLTRQESLCMRTMWRGALYVSLSQETKRPGDYAVDPGETLSPAIACKLMKGADFTRATSIWEGGMSFSARVCSCRKWEKMGSMRV